MRSVIDLHAGGIVRRSAAPPRHLQRVIALLTRFEPGSIIPTSELDEWTAAYGAEVVEAAVVELGEKGALTLPNLRTAVERADSELVRRNRNERAGRRMARGGEWPAIVTPA